MGENEQKSFTMRVYDVVARIPYGRVTTYGRIALMLGSPRAARQVGWAMRHCPDKAAIQRIAGFAFGETDFDNPADWQNHRLPWQRVVKSDGTVAGGDWSEVRRALLEEEGVPFTSDGRVDLKACGWPGDD